MKPSSEPRRIVILDTGREWGGGTNSLLELLKRINREKFKFGAIFYRNYPKGTESDIRRELEKLGVEFFLVPRRKLPPKVKIFKEFCRAGAFWLGPFRKDLLFFFDSYFRIQPQAGDIARILRDFRADLLYMNNQPASNLEGILAAERVGIPAILHCRIAKRVPRIAIRKTNARVQKVICVSRGLRDFYVSQGLRADLCTVIYNGIDLSLRPREGREALRKRWGLPPEDFVLGTVCSLVKRKRVQDLLEAAYLVQRRTSVPIKILIVGDGPERKKLEALSQRLGFSSRTLFAGFQSDPLSFIQAMDLFVFPSEKEGFPRVLLEAMLLGKPVIAARIPGPSELVKDGETGFLVEPRQPEALARAIMKLLQDRELAQTMGEKGRKRVEQFDIRHYVSGVSRVFEEVLNCSTSS
ncbi:MAG TPA: glycosyltransferase family 1 protein [Thermosulfurimonas dismutans]|uniref:Glycosyltransferase family 1 protein n=1 Tax=Thermosulfurimonas dismutans TaxID=999894 RepID=A0A7C3CXY2_9BACT|nr:glycosyltransferase family 1 protein [Thermosulfurimonas dismutans]